MNIQDNFVPYDIALELKEIGFNEECLAWFTKTESISMDNTLRGVYKRAKWFCEAPLWQQVVDWFRNKHRIHIFLNPQTLIGLHESSNYYYSIVHCDHVNSSYFSSYYIALEAAIKKAIQMIK